MIIIWVLQLLLEVLATVLEPRVRLLWAGILKDIKPLVATHNFFASEENDWNIDFEEYEGEIKHLSNAMKEEKKKLIEKSELVVCTID